MDEKARCEGIVVPVVTPICVAGKLDKPALRRVIGHVLKGGAHGVFVLGTMGEGPSVSPAMREEVVRIAAEEVGGRIPLYAGITHPGIDATVAEARRWKAAGVDVLVSVCPYYLPINDREILLYFERLAESTGGPLMLYDIPAMTKVTISPNVVETLSRDPRIIGYKDSRNDAPALWKLIERFGGREDFSILVGVEHLLPDALLRGAAGGVCGGANVRPQLFVAIYEAARSHDIPALNSLRSNLTEFLRFYELGDSASSMIGGVKAALECLGICSRYLLPPLVGFDDQQVEKVRAALEELGFRM